MSRSAQLAVVTALNIVLGLSSTPSPAATPSGSEAGPCSVAAVQGGGGGGPGSGCEDGEIHDDGTPENGYGAVASATSVYYVEKFTPPSYPWSYEQVCVAWTRNGLDSQINHRLVIYDDDGPSGAPQTLLGDLPTTASGVPTYPGSAFFSTDVRGRFPVITAGSVYIGVTWSPATEQQFYVSADQSPATPLADGHEWLSSDGVWRTIDYFHPDYRAMFIRASGSPADLVAGCSFGDTAGDNLDRGYYVPSYPGLTLDQVTMYFTGSPAGTYTIELTARTGAFDGALVGTAQVTVDLTSAMAPVTFLFGGVPTSPFVPLTFSMSLVGGPGVVFFDTGPCGSGGCTSCHNIIETNSTTPPLSSVRRRSVAVSIFGRGAVVFEDDFEHGCALPWSGTLGYVAGPWTCPAGSAVDPEPCPTDGTDPDQDPNGGCNSVPPSFGVIAMGGTVCGTTGTFVASGGGDYRDTDWYSFAAPGDGYYRVSGGGEQELQLYVVDRTNCGAPELLGGAVAEAGCQTSFVTWLEAGTYAVFVAPTVFTGASCAPATRDYWIGIEPTPPP